MQAKDMYQGLLEKTINAETLAKQAETNLEVVDFLIEGMKEKPASVKYGSGKALRMLVDSNPQLLYPYFDHFVEMLDREAKIFKWQALYMLAGLAGVDEEQKTAGILDKYFSEIQGPMMITAANAIKWSAKIVKSQPDLADRVMGYILLGEQGVYESAECHAIVCGTAINSFYKMRKWVSQPKTLFDFAERHRDSARIPTKKAAEKFIARYEKELAAKR